MAEKVEKSQSSTIAITSLMSNFSSMFLFIQIFPLHFVTLAVNEYPQVADEYHFIG